MPTRHDAVLLAIPVLALGGAGLARAVHALEATVGVGGRLAPVPFTVIGLLAALLVIGREVLFPSFEAGR